MNLKEEDKRATELLQGKTVANVVRHREKEVLVEFTDGTRFFIDHLENKLDLSITGGESKSPQD